MIKLLCGCGRRKIWFVYTYGTIMVGGEKTRLNRKSKPFRSKSAANLYRHEWNEEYAGFAVVDYELLTDDELRFAEDDLT